MKFSTMLCTVLLAACVPTANAAIYKWTDAQGRVSFGDQWSAQARNVKLVRSNQPSGTATPQAGAVPVMYAQTAAAPAATQPSAASGPTLNTFAVTTPLAASGTEFPRLLGMNIGEKNYQDLAYQKALARLDVVILGFYKGWTASGATINSVVKSLKMLNPDILIGQYTILSEAYKKDGIHLPDYDKAFKLDNEGWWLRKADGSMVQWTTAYQAWQTNISGWTKPDFNGDRYPEWLAKRDYQAYFHDTPDFGIWYFDNVGQRPEVSLSDWNLDGRNDSNDAPNIASAYRAGHAAEWSTADQLAPKVLRMGNISAAHNLGFPEYKGKLNGAFMEGMMGYTWSIEKWAGWGKMMTFYHGVFPNLAAPAIVGFNVSGRPDDYRFFRYAYTSCLMDDGYFSFTDQAVGYSSVPWFDEYDVKLGHAVDAPQGSAWQNGVYRRVFERGMVLVNPTVYPVSVSVGAGYKRFAGRQDTAVNSGAPAHQITIPPRDGLVLVKS